MRYINTPKTTRIIDIYLNINVLKNKPRNWPNLCFTYNANKDFFKLKGPSNMKNLQTMKHSVQKGFTLIELMIVVAIIGILAALAIPAYSDYTIKAKASEAGTLTGAVKTAVEIYWSEEADLPGSFADIDALDGATFESTYVSSISIQADGVISVILTGNATLQSETVIYTPSTGQTNIKWDVLDSSLATKYRPKP